MKTTKKKSNKNLPLWFQMRLSKFVFISVIVLGFALIGALIIINSRAAVTLKPLAAGLMTTRPDTLGQNPYMNHMAIHVNWSQLEPSPGQYDWSPIDNVLKAHPTTKARIRMFAGDNSPNWLKTQVGPCVQVQNDQEYGGSGCVPRFWTETFQNRFQLLMQRMASKYDTNNQVLEVVNTACTTIHAENFLIGDNESAIRLFKAGMNEDSYRYCMNKSTESMMNAFTYTRPVTATHTQWVIATANGKQTSWPKERDLLNQLRSKYGGKLGIINNGLGPDDYCAPGQSLATATSFYCWMASLPAPKGFQFTLRGGSMEQAAQNGEKMNSCVLEFAGFSGISDPRAMDTKLKENCKGGGAPVPGPAPAPTPTLVNGLKGQYFANETLSGTPAVTRIDDTVLFDWSNDSSPASQMPINSFSARWTGKVYVANSNNFTFYTTSDDGVRLWIDGVQRINDWEVQSAATNQTTVSLSPGHHDIKLEYFERTGGASVKLEWSSSNFARKVIQNSSLFTTP